MVLYNGILLIPQNQVEIREHLLFIPEILDGKRQIIKVCVISWRGCHAVVSEAQPCVF